MLKIKEIDMFNKRKDGWVFMRSNEDMPPIGVKVMILLEEDVLFNQEFYTKEERYYPITCYAIFRGNNHWDLIHEDKKFEQIVLQSQTVVGWRPI